MAGSWVAGLDWGIGLDFGQGFKPGLWAGFCCSKGTSELGQGQPVLHVQNYEQTAKSLNLRGKWEIPLAWGGGVLASRHQMLLLFQVASNGAQLSPPCSHGMATNPSHKVPRAPSRPCLIDAESCAAPQQRPKGDGAGLEPLGWWLQHCWGSRPHHQHQGCTWAWAQPRWPPGHILPVPVTSPSRDCATHAARTAPRRCRVGLVSGQRCHEPPRNPDLL